MNDEDVPEVYKRALEEIAWVFEQLRKYNKDEELPDYVIYKTLFFMLRKKAENHDALEAENEKLKDNFDTILADYKLDVSREFSKEKEKLENFLKKEVNRAEAAEADLKKVVESYGISDLYLKEITEE